MIPKDLPNQVVLIDFGSTYTKMAVADLKTRSLVTADHFPSTVATDARLGLEQCFQAAKKAMGEKAFRASMKLASSSAAGGLRMGVIGLSRTLSIAAGRNAAFGAGAKILKTTSGRLSREDMEELAALPLEIILFCGGYEEGGTKVLDHNIEMLAQSRLPMPIIYAGNSRAAPAVRRAFSLSGKEFYVVRNILPDVGEVDKVQVENIIRDVFLNRIINMKNLDKVAAMLDRLVMPTPASVLRAGELLALGSPSREGWGPVMLIDVGGATTDIHSYARPAAYEGAKMVGAKESFAKRTVEGDLGLRESSNSLMAEIGLAEAAAETGLKETEIQAVIERWLDDHDLLPVTEAEKKVDRLLARGAVHISARRHAGRIEHISSAGVKSVQHGKNLTEVKAVIGTGGPLIFSDNSVAALGSALRKPELEPDVLLPAQAGFYLDRDYIFYAAGLLREIDEEAAFCLMEKSLKGVA